MDATPNNDNDTLIKILSQVKKGHLDRNSPSKEWDTYLLVQLCC